MGRFHSAKNQVAFRYESGTYNAAFDTGGQWLGLVQDHTADENPNVITARFLGAGDRNVGQFIDGPLDFPGTITMFPQDWKFMLFALGSCKDTGSPVPSTHTIREQSPVLSNSMTSGTLNPFISFALEDAQQFNVTGLNFVRSFGGCMVDSLTLAGTQGEPLSMDINYIAQTMVYSSGTVRTLTEATTRPYMWSDCSLEIPSGTTFDEMLDFSWSVNNNINAPHYLNGSREVSIPIPENRDYEFNVTLHGTSAKTKTLYDKHFIGGSPFNVMLEILDNSNRFAYIIMSGCNITSMDAPSPMEGVNEQSITIVPTKCSVNAKDSIQLYNAWSGA